MKEELYIRRDSERGRGLGRSRPLRFHVARDQYLIAYAPDEKPLWVLGIFHERRNPRLMAAILRDRP